jgi:hypothetical protein
VVWVLSVLLAALSGLAGGYLLGWFAGRHEAEGPRQARPQAGTPAAEKAPDIKPATGEGEKVAGTAIKPAPPSRASNGGDKPPIKVIAAPEAALKAFLSAPSWEERAKHSLLSENTADQMRSYYSQMPDGAVKALRVKLNDSHGKDGEEPVFYSYLVSTEAHQEGYPVAVVRTTEGWKIDWGSFVEFEDDHFSRFAGGQGGDTGKFHLLVRMTNFATPRIEGYSAFRIDPPMPGRDRYAFVPTDSELERILRAAATPGHPASAVLELKRHPTEGGKNWLEITAIVAPNWWPESE